MDDNSEIPTIPEPSGESLIERLAPFKESNPKAEVVRVGDRVEIRRPWDDASIMFSIGDGQQDVVDVLNSVYLPPPYSAIWHKDSKDIEFIYTSLPLVSTLIKRSFGFFYQNQEIICEYSPASERLIALSKMSKFTRMETTSAYRNLHSFQAGIKYRDEGNKPLDGFGLPTSFWIRNVDWNDEYISELCKHINFYMRYYDRETPCIAMHQNVPDALGTPDRYVHGAFPSTIRAKSLSPDLLDLIAICGETSDPIRRIMHSYQILEYVAHYYTKNDVFRKIRRLLLSPDAIDRIDSVLEDSIDAITIWVKDDDQRMKAVIKDYIEPDSLWTVIEQYKGVFSQDIIFDGGHSQGALIQPTTTLKDFGNPGWADGFFSKWKTLRNLVVHARESRHNSRISPTEANIELLRPWALLSMTAAEQLIIYRENRKTPAE